MAKRALKEEESYTCNDFRIWANKAKGENTVLLGTEDFMDWPRMPTGIFSLDYASGGGIPLYCGTQVAGPESGGKTTSALNMVATAQQFCYGCMNVKQFCTCGEEPDMRNALWVAFENILEMSWARDVGVDLERFMPIRPSSGNEGLDLVRKAVHASDCGLIVIDSLAAITPDAFLEEEAFERNDMALQARLLTKFANSMMQEINRNIKSRHKIAVVILNQVRFDPTIRFGSPEVFTGGNAFKHFWGLSFRFSKLKLEDKWKKKYDVDDREWVTRHHVKINKFKCRVFTENAEFIRSKETVPDLEISRGEVIDYHVVLKYAKEHGVITGDGPYILFPENNEKMWASPPIKAATLDEIKLLWRQRRDYYLQTQKAILDSQRVLLDSQKAL